MPARHWGDLKTTDFDRLDPATTVAILPLAAIEQHGPHLPVSTDTSIMQGMIETAFPLVGDGVTALFLPIEAVAKSNEHLHSKGTLTLSAETVLRGWIEIGESVKRAGISKIVLLTSHGGNLDPMRVVARELRVRFGQLAVVTSWTAFGRPPGLYGDLDIKHGIHGGDVETSLMLHFRPDLVDMAHAKLFEPIMVSMEKEFTYLRPTVNHAFGWMAQDIHPDGTAGDASLATADKGKATAAWQAGEFVKLLDDMARFDIRRLYKAT
ncbi:creatininase family protein [Phreatobacter oligotrophus]|jgi:creatinine amidohydrolase|uniref:Creatinine amidohydrolase n=1 Tax=Phreatobacter oligotrophus TaxID=1122261 RepID=A0A2T4ZJ84_9HYPH|nr:creatininase family protein [Phreatobacter oligotrophus]PTM62048.1 creatinine amidohydrolase [Phreatobacter oligotrophus]